MKLSHLQKDLRSQKKTDHIRMVEKHIVHKGYYNDEDSCHHCLLFVLEIQIGNYNEDFSLDLREKYFHQRDILSKEISGICLWDVWD